MRTTAALLLAGLALSGAACSLDQLLKQQGGGSTAGDGGAADASADAAAPVQGAGCGVEGESGAQLCRATALCPNVVVDSEAFPHCGFRIRAGVVDLVCACGQSICSMGVYSTCAQAAQLLSSQTEQQVCMQVNENRCSAVAPAPATSGASSSGGRSTCDKTCLSECGGGAACASICGCN